MFTFLCLLWLAYQLGSKDGKWGCFTFLLLFVVFVLISSLVK